MPAVANVLVVGAGAAGTAAAILLARGGVSVDLVDIKPDISALGSGITLQGNALRVLRELGVWDQVPEHGLRRSTPSACAHPTPHGTLIVELDDVRTGGPDLPATVGMYRPDAGHDPGRAGHRGRRQGPVRHHLHRASTRTTAASTSPSPTARPAATTWSSAPTASAPGPAAPARHRPGDQSTGMGIWRVFAPRPDSVHPHRPLSTAAPATSPATARPARTPCTPTSSSRPRTAAASTPDEQLAVMRELVAGLPRPVGRDPRRHDRPGQDQLHVVRDARARGALEPRPGRADRRRRPHLPADRGPGRGPGARGRRRAQRAADRPRHRSTTTCGTSSTGRRFDRAKTVVDASCSSASWLLDGERGDVPGLMAGVAHLLSEPRLTPEPGAPP